MRFSGLSGNASVRSERLCGIIWARSTGGMWLARGPRRRCGRSRLRWRGSRRCSGGWFDLFALGPGELDRYAPDYKVFLLQPFTRPVDRINLLLLGVEYPKPPDQ